MKKLLSIVTQLNLVTLSVTKGLHFVTLSLSKGLLLIVVFLILSLSKGYAQTGDIRGRRIIADQSIQLRTVRIDSIQRDTTNWSDKTNEIPTASAIWKFVKGRSGTTPTLQQVLTAGSVLTQDNHITGQNRSLYFDSLLSFQIKSTFSPTLGRSYAQFNQNGIYLTHGTTGTTGSSLLLQKGRVLMNATNSAIDFYPEIGSYSTYISDGLSKTSYFKMYNDSIYFAADKFVFNLPTKGSGKVLTSDAYGGASWQTPATGADTSYTTIATFTAGGGFASDTTMCTDSTLIGSFYTGQFDYTIAYIQAVIKGNAGDSIVLKLVYNDTFNVDGTKVSGAGLSVNNRYTGNTFTIGTNRVIAANTWVWLKPEAVITGKKPKYISVTLVGYKTYVAP